MKQTFLLDDFNKFKTLLNIKETPSITDINLLNKSKKYLKYAKFIPWIKLIAVWNSVWMNNSTPDSDIDLFVITHKNTLWFVRIALTFFMQIFWLRKTHKKHAWRFCLSFFCTTQSMNFSDFAIENDIYLYFWIVHLKPILDIDNTFDSFIKAQSWADFSEYLDIIDENKKSIIFKKSTNQEKYQLISILNKVLKSIFLPRSIESCKKLWNPYWIIIHDNMLKFHNNDKRKEIKKEIFG